MDGEEGEAYTQNKKKEVYEGGGYQGGEAKGRPSGIIKGRDTSIKTSKKGKKAAVLRGAS